MTDTMKSYIRSFLPNDMCIPCALSRKDALHQQAAKTGLVVALAQSGIAPEEIRKLLGIPSEVESLIGGSWTPTKCLTVTQLFEEVEKILESC